MGYILKEMNQYEEALNYCEKSLDIRKKIFNKHHPFIAASQEYLGYVYEKKQDYKNAFSNHSSALNNFKKYFGKRNIYVANSFNNIANIHLKTEEYDKAILNYNEALLANSSSIDSLHKDEKFDPKNYLNFEILLFTLSGKGKVEMLKYKKNKNINSLMNAANIYLEADRTIDYERQILNNYADKVTFAKQTKEIFNEAIEVQLLSYNEVKNQKAIYQAFYYTEKSKANTLKHLLNEANAKSFSGLSKDLIKLEKRTSQSTIN